MQYDDPNGPGSGSIVEQKRLKLKFRSVGSKLESENSLWRSLDLLT